MVLITGRPTIHIGMVVGVGAVLTGVTGMAAGVGAVAGAGVAVGAVAGMEVGTATGTDKLIASFKLRGFAPERLARELFFEGLGQLGASMRRSLAVYASDGLVISIQCASNQCLLIPVFDGKLITDYWLVITFTLGDDDLSPEFDEAFWGSSSRSGRHVQRSERGDFRLSRAERGRQKHHDQNVNDFAGANQRVGGDRWS